MMKVLIGKYKYGEDEAKLEIESMIENVRMIRLSENCDM